MIAHTPSTNEAVPTPRGVNQHAVEKEHQKAENQLKQLSQLVTEMETLVDHDPETCKIKYFDVDYLLVQIPESMRSPELMERINALSRKLTHHEKTLQDISLADTLQPPEPPQDHVPYEDFAGEVGLDQDTSPSRFAQNVAEDEHQAVLERAHHPEDADAHHKQQEAQELSDYHKVERVEQKEVDKHFSTDSIRGVGNTVDALESPPAEPRKHVVYFGRSASCQPHTPRSPTKSSSQELYDKGLECVEQRDYEKAIQYFRAVLKRTPNNIAARIRIQQAQEKQSLLATPDHK